MTTTRAIEIHHVTKTYGGLRPLRIASLAVEEGERVSIGGLEAGTGELVINLVTGASLPDSGAVTVFGRRTDDIRNGDDWLEWLDRFGIVSPRGVLLEGSTLLQNLAMPLTLSIDPVPDDVAGMARALAHRCGIDPERWLGVTAGEAPADIRARAHLAKAIALDPKLLIIEHPTADVDPGARQALAADIARTCSAPGLTTIVLTNDEAFARAVAPRNLKLHAATGALKPLAKGWFTW